MGEKKYFKLNIYFLILINIFLIYGCANIVAPTGGSRDITPPKPESFEPANKSINFKEKKIKIID